MAKKQPAAAAKVAPAKPAPAKAPRSTTGNWKLLVGGVVVIIAATWFGQFSSKKEEVKPEPAPTLDKFAVDQLAKDLTNSRTQQEFEAGLADVMNKYGLKPEQMTRTMALLKKWSDDDTSKKEGTPSITAGNAKPKQPVKLTKEQLREAVDGLVPGSAANDGAAAMKPEPSASASAARPATPRSAAVQPNTDEPPEEDDAAEADAEDRKVRRRGKRSSA
jgi:hypothetical protein